MNERDMKVLEAATKLAPAAMAEAADREGYQRHPNHCIAATKIGVGVLANFGIEATPVPCNLIVGNRQWIDWLKHGMPQPMPFAAWSVAVHEQNTDGPGYNGHVMLRAGDMLADLNFGQVSRPEKGMKLPPAVVFPPHGDYLEKFEAGKEIVYFDDDDNAVIIEPTLGRKSFMQAKDWQRTHQTAIDILTEAVQKVLDLEQSTE